MAQLLIEDFRIRKYLERNLTGAEISVSRDCKSWR